MMPRSAISSTSLRHTLRTPLWIAGSLLLLAMLLLSGLFIGSTAVPAGDVLTAVLRPTESDGLTRAIVFESRLPALLTAVIAGASLSVAGLLMQTVFANPLADASLLGVGTGASLGVAVALLLLGGTLAAGAWTLSGFVALVTAAFVGAMIVVVLLMSLSTAFPGKLMLLVAGVMISFLGSSLISLLAFFSTAQGVQSFFMWGMGSFHAVSLGQLPIFALVAGVALCGTMLLTKPLDALLLGDDYAQGLGINLGATRLVVLALTGLLVALVTALCGPVSFIGLAVPHIVRFMLRRSTHRLLLPFSMVWGAIICLLCLLVTYLPGDHGLLPLNVVTPLLGVPVVFAVLLRHRQT